VLSILWPAGHSIESAVSYFAVEVNDALDIAERIELRSIGAGLPRSARRQLRSKGANFWREQMQRAAYKEARASYSVISSAAKGRVAIRA
jgi:hypothetical protein